LVCFVSSRNNQHWQQIGIWRQGEARHRNAGRVSVDCASRVLRCADRRRRRRRETNQRANGRQSHLTRVAVLEDNKSMTMNDYYFFL
jgi:hypothetical protein